MPHYLGIAPGDLADQPWTTAHGDLHYANLCAPQLHMLDWEGWGLAPAGYDAAMLHSRSLLAPAAAGRVHAEFGDLLNTAHGRFAELAVITELLDAAANGINTVLAEPLRSRAAALLQQSAPSV